jgi:hypothetical protein
VTGAGVEVVGATAGGGTLIGGDGSRAAGGGVTTGSRAGVRAGS